MKTDYGYHIIQVEEHRPAKEANFEESRERIKEILFEQQAQTEYGNWMQELYQQYKVETFLGNE